MKRTRSVIGVGALLLLLLALILLGVWNPFDSSQAGAKSDQTLTIYHAGSLSVPMRELTDAFKQENPGVTFRMEAAGSIHCIRKITELNQPCDVLAVADFSLIDELMIPVFATWNLQFATNDLCLAYTERSGGQDSINLKNWYKILIDNSIAYGRSDPDADPCGYRTIMALQLADLLYLGGIGAEAILDKDNRYIRSKETDLNALLESRAVDYIFTYRSVAVQHKFRYLPLPDSINLGNPDLAEWYANAEVSIPGSKPGERIIKKGAPMVYGLTIPQNTTNRELALSFIRFMVDPEKGGRIIEECGQNFINPLFSPRSTPEESIFL
ncbi:MAG: extracellular solute-binding protein [Bacteroidales bacterium]|nr:extracellular solute-binding protein [Bacteroidales bacterium]